MLLAYGFFMEGEGFARHGEFAFTVDFFFRADIVVSFELSET